MPYITAANYAQNLPLIVELYLRRCCCFVMGCEAPEEG